MFSNGIGPHKSPSVERSCSQLAISDVGVEKLSAHERILL